MSETSFFSTLRQALAALPHRLLLRLNPPRRPLLVRALQHQALRARNLHQALEVHQLARCWLAARQDRAQVNRSLQLRMLELGTNPQPSPTSTSSSEQTAPSTTKRRR